MRCLYLQQNVIKKIENLEPLQRLDTLNISNNQIRKIENIACLPVLHSLIISHNKLQMAEDIEELALCENLGILDLSHNKISDPGVVEVFEKMKDLRVLSLMGNPVIKEIKNYRKSLIVRLKNLQHLDDRPVFPKDRACAEAWAVGGLDGEKQEREKWVNKERKKIQDSVDALLAVRNRVEAHRIEKELNEKNAAEGNFEKVEVDPNTVDWLYGTYKLKTDKQTTQECQVKRETESSDPPEEITVVKPRDEVEDEGIFSGTKSKPDDSTRIYITELSESDMLMSQGAEPDDLEDLPDLEDIDVSERILIEKASSEVYKPRIEMLDDEDDTFPSSQLPPLATHLPQTNNKSGKVLIEELSDRTCCDFEKSQDACSNDSLNENEKHMTDEVVSLECVEPELLSVHAEETNGPQLGYTDLLEGIGKMLNSSISESGEISVGTRDNGLDSSKIANTEMNLPESKDSALEEGCNIFEELD